MVIFPYVPVSGEPIFPVVPVSFSPPVLIPFTVKSEPSISASFEVTPVEGVLDKEDPPTSNSP